MIDIAQNLMADGNLISIAHVSGINDNMSQSHYHDYFELYFLDSGERFHLMDDKLYKLQSGDCMIFPPQTMHHSYGEKDCAFSRVVIYFKPEAIKSDELRKQLIETKGVFRPDKETLKNIRRLIYVMNNEQNTPGSFHLEVMLSLLNLIMIQTLRMSHSNTVVSRENRTTKIIQYIYTHYAQDISLPELAEMFHVSEYYLCREFKKNTNRTIVEFIKRTRIMNAQLLFSETDKNVTTVASETGFSNLTHFNRVFKEITGVTPSKYRKKFQNSSSK